MFSRQIKDQILDILPYEDDDYVHSFKRFSIDKNKKESRIQTLMFIIVFDSKEEIFEKQSRRGVIGEMEQYIRGVAFMAIPALIFCGILANSMRKDRSRYRNTFFVMFAGISVVGFLCALAGPYSGLVFLACFILILLSILIAPVSLIINGIIMIRKEGKRLPNLLSLFVRRIGDRYHKPR